VHDVRASLLLLPMYVMSVHDAIGLALIEICIGPIVLEELQSIVPCDVEGLEDLLVVEETT